MGNVLQHTSSYHHTEHSAAPLEIVSAKLLNSSGREVEDITKQAQESVDLCGGQIFHIHIGLTSLLERLKKARKKERWWKRLREKLSDRWFKLCVRRGFNDDELRTTSSDTNEDDSVFVVGGSSCVVEEKEVMEHEAGIGSRRVRRKDIYIILNARDWVYCSTKPFPAKGISIINGIYGDLADLRRCKDVTPQLRNFVKKGVVLMLPEGPKNQILGDLNLGTAKRLVIVYARDGVIHTRICPENASLSIASDYYLDQEISDMLVEETYFDEEELDLLFVNFLDMSCSDSLSRRRFLSLFPELHSDEILRSMFTILDLNGDGNIDFVEFARILSIVARGTPREKAEIAFDLLDMGRKGYISRDDANSVINVLINFMTEYHVGFINDVDPVEFLSWLFQKKFENPDSKLMRSTTEDVDGDDVSGRQSVNDDNNSNKSEDYSEHVDLNLDDKAHVMVDRLSRDDFLRRAKQSPYVANCFGLFNFFSNLFLQPIENKLSNDSEVTIEGSLEKEKGRTIVHKTIGFLTEKDVRYFQVRGGFLAYAKSSSEIDKPINVINLSDATVREIAHHGFRIRCVDFCRDIYPPSRQFQKSWIDVIRKNIKIGSSASNRFQSFAPVREGINCRFFLNGNEYYRALTEILPRARKRIFISDWYLSPELYLTRQQPLDHSKRLDNLLLHIANTFNVEIYILIWNASAFSFDLKPQEVIDRMNSLSPNIYAIAHPNVHPIAWSHHQKLVVVDDEVAFIGGLDLCFGRYDDEVHRVTDPYGMTFPGRDYANLNFVGETNGKIHVDILDRHTFARMPWHDIQVQLDGSAAGDAAFNFIQRWNVAVKDLPLAKKATQTFPFLMPLPRNMVKLTALLKTEKMSNDKGKDRDSAGDWLDDDQKVMMRGRNRTIVHTSLLQPEELGSPGCQCQLVRSIAYWSAGVPTTEKSVYHSYVHHILNAQKYIYIENQYFVSSIFRNMPENRIAGALYLRLRKAIESKEKFRVMIVLPVYPAGDMLSPTTRYIVKHVYKSINREEDSLFQKLSSEFPTVDISDYVTFFSLRNYGNLGHVISREQVDTATNMDISSRSSPLLTSVDLDPISSSSESSASLSVSSFTHSVPGTSSSPSWLPTGSYSLLDAVSIVSMSSMIEPPTDASCSEVDQFSLSESLSLSQSSEPQLNPAPQSLPLKDSNLSSLTSEYGVEVSVQVGTADPDEADGLSSSTSSSSSSLSSSFSPSPCASQLPDTPLSISSPLPSRSSPTPIQFRSASDRTLRSPSITPSDPEKMVTEQIYVHAKIMLVDDRVAIIGSANINDRSFAGDRDSEICAVIENEPVVDSIMDGQPYKVGEFALQLRKKIWRHILNISPEEEEIIQDPISDATYHGILRKTASNNTQIFTEVFEHLPDVVRNSSQLQKRQEEGERPRVDQTYRLSSLKGFLVYFPLAFMEEDHFNMSPSFFDKEFIVPKSVFL